MQSYSFLPLHGGNAPKWLFERMVKLGEIIVNEIIDEYGEDELIERITDPYWFQALSCTLGYDWHSSGTTTVTMAVLKEILNKKSDIYIAGGKGKVGLRTPDEIIDGSDYLSISKSEKLIDYSKIIAKIDSSLIYDNFGIYHHTFIFSKNKWGVVQQGMFNDSNFAVRFQVISDKIDKNNLSNETNSNVYANLHKKTFDLTFYKNKILKDYSLDAINDDINSLLSFDKTMYLPSRHNILNTDISPRAKKLLKDINDIKPESYDELLLSKGVGGKTLKSIAIISSLIYKSDIYERDPIMYSYNVGGKDGIPYTISKSHYDDVIKNLKDIIDTSKISDNDRQGIMKRLSYYVEDEYNKFK